MLSDYQKSKIRSCLTWGKFPNLMQAGRRCLVVAGNTWDRREDRRAILAYLWEYHTQIARGEIPFQTLIAGAALLLLTSSLLY
jgi:hypothetical protein